jgi:hypothetical protein
VPLPTHTTKSHHMCSSSSNACWVGCCAGGWPVTAAWIAENPSNRLSSYQPSQLAVLINMLPAGDCCTCGWQNSDAWKTEAVVQHRLKALIQVRAVEIISLVGLLHRWFRSTCCQAADMTHNLLSSYHTSRLANHKKHRSPSQDSHPGTAHTSRNRLDQH